jgi:hypothetical protein
MATNARDAADAIARDLEGRAGFGNEWDMIPDDIKEEIVAEWTQIIENAVGR